MIPVSRDIISISSLTKSYGRLTVLDNLDLQIEEGKVTAIIGHNGSGKTTLIKSILGLVKPDAGRIFFEGHKLNGDCMYRERIGYMPQSATFPENLKGTEVLAMLKDLRGPEHQLDVSLLDSFQLGEELNKPIRTLSGGTRQKVSAACAFLFNPAFLILDEPTAGLDPVASEILKDKISDLRVQGRTFIISSHIVSEIEELADEIVFLQNGKVHFSGRPEDIKRNAGQKRLDRAIAFLMRQTAA